MALRLLQAALWRKRGMVALAVLAVAIGGSVAGALLHVSRDISHKLTRELRTLGPNLILVPPEQAGSQILLDDALAHQRLRAAGLDGASLLFLTATIGERRLPVVGADLEAVRKLHPSWKLTGSSRGALLGVRLARRLGAGPGDSLEARFGDGGRSYRARVGATLESGTADDEAWWIPLADAQTLAGETGAVSLVQARLDDPDRVSAITAQLEQGGGVRAVVLHELSSTEADLLQRTRRLMTYVTLGVLIAAGLCAFGTLTDLALERRREIALLKTLGATGRDVVLQFGAESLVVGLLGGALGWWIGIAASGVIGRQVFRSSIVALAAATGPIRLALAVEPAPVLRGD